VRTVNGAPYGLTSNDGIIISVGELVCILYRTVPASAVPADVDTPMFFTLEDIPLSRDAGPLQSLFLVVDGRPSIDVTPALPTNPHIGADVFAMDIIGWKLGS